MRKIDEVIQEIERAATKFRFVREVIPVDVTKFSVKYRLIVSKDLYIQIYVNVRNGTHGFALVQKGKRLYGRDSEDWKWHRHPLESPEVHDFSLEGAKEVSVEDFLKEVQEILARKGLIP